MTPRVAVVVPAHNEGSNIVTCLASLKGQSTPIRVLVSDNNSTDDTREVLARLAEPGVVVRRTSHLLGASEHFVSCGRWALDTGDEQYLALLAADDQWGPGFAAKAVLALDENPDFGMVFPTYVWNEPGGQRQLRPPALSSSSARVRQLRAMTMGNRHEIANQVYGLFRRRAFERLMDNWEAGGGVFGADFASVIELLRTERSLPLPDVVGLRSARAGEDLIERIGVNRPEGGNLTSTGRAYIRLNTRLNSGIGRALSSVTGRPAWLTIAGTQVLRTPQWIGEIPMQLKERST